MRPEQRGQAALVLGAQLDRVVGVVEDVLDHQHVHVDECGLADPQAQHAHFLLVAAVRGNFGVLAVEDDRVRAVPGLDHVQAAVGLPLKLPGAQVAG
jgi:hypothetical protein